MIPKHIHEAALEKAAIALWQANGPPCIDHWYESLTIDERESYTREAQAVIAAYLSHITGDVEVIEGAGDAVHQQDIDFDKYPEENLVGSYWRGLAKAALSYLKPDNAREGE